MQRYFDRLFGLQAPDNSNFVLNDPRITPEFFAVLAKDHGDYISRKKHGQNGNAHSRRSKELNSAL